MKSSVVALTVVAWLCVFSSSDAWFLGSSKYQGKMNLLRMCEPFYFIFSNLKVCKMMKTRNVFNIVSYILFTRNVGYTILKLTYS